MAVDAATEILRQAGGPVVETTDALIKQAVETLAERQRQYYKYTAYYNGDQPLVFATDKFLNTFGSLFRALADNLCPAVVDAVADRLHVVGVDVEMEDDANTAAMERLANDAWRIWQANRMDRRSGQVHLEALRAGDASIIVWPDVTGSPRIYPQRADQVVVHYDEESDETRIDWAAKFWRLSDGKVRMTLYFTDRIEKYVTTTRVTGELPKNLGRYELVEKPGEPNPVLNPWGIVPVFHFANNAHEAEYGRSELADVVPIQDALNKSLCDMLVAMEYVSLPQRYATGLEIEIDPETGKPKNPFTTTPGALWTETNPAARFGDFAAADLKQLLDVQNSLRLEVARVSGTPLHYLMLLEGNLPSGESLKVSEMRFSAKVEDRQIAFGNVWEDALAFALRIQGQQVTGLQLGATWKPAASVSERESVQTDVFKRQVGIPLEQVLRERGYTEQQIAGIMQQVEAERTASADLLERQMTAGAFEE